MKGGNYMLNTEKGKRLPIARFVLCAIFIMLFLYDPAESSRELGRGLSLCAGTLIPTLFPFMVISEILVRADIASFISPILSKPMKVLFGVSGSGAAALILGLICGFPVGGKTAAALYERGDISKTDAERLMSFCNLPSAPFMIFAVGEKLFGSREFGVFLYLNVLAVTLICGILLNFIKGRKRPEFYPEKQSMISESLSMIRIFTESVTSAAWSTVNVCAYVAFFTCAVGSLGNVFAGFGEHFRVILFSFFELTSGSAACSSLGQRQIGVILASAAAGWSGLSVFFQIFSLTRTARGDISMKDYLASKTLAAILCPSITLIAIRIRPSLFPNTLPDSDAFLRMPYFPAHFISGINIIFILSLLIYLYKELDRRRKI
jgi:sporulation integral membrane protein YlbJ